MAILSDFPRSFALGSDDSSQGKGLAKYFLWLAAIVVLAASPGRVWAIDVNQTRWGFDGQATPQCFNLLSVLVSNPEPEAFDGTLELRQSFGGGSRVGAPLAEEVYISPHSSRWVQFYPYVKERFEDWSLHWRSRNGGLREERADVPQPVLAEQGPVLLVDADDLPGRTAALRQFPENLFPPMVTATDALKTVALDHVPRWEEARRQAFYDWLFRGGRLHLFKDINGAYPQFSAGLAELNAPAEQFRVGAGRVIRHDRPRSRIDSQFVAKNFEAGTAGPVAAAGSIEESEEGDETVDNEVGPRRAQPSPGGSNSGRRNSVNFRVTSGAESADALFADLTGGLFAYLKSLTRAHHNWTLIYSMAVVYVLTVVPGVHILGRMRFDYRIVYGTLVGLILLFSLGFTYVGRRGHNEANSVNSVAVARQLADGALDVTSWSNEFVINGGDHAISHKGTGRLYSPAQSFEAINGVIHNGAQGAFYVDIPPYSSQPFLHRVKLKSDPIEVRVQEFSPKTKLARLVLIAGKNFPHPAGSNSVYVLDRDQIYPMTWTNGRLELVGSQTAALTQFLRSIRSDDFSPFSGRYNFGANGSQSVDAPPFENLLRPLIAWSLGLRRHAEIPKFFLPDDRVRLFVWSELPDSLKVEGLRPGSQQGRVLYVVDILKPVKP